MATVFTPLSKIPAAALALAVSSLAGFAAVSPIPALAVSQVTTLEALDTGNYSDSEFYPPDPFDSNYIAGYYDLFLPGEEKEVDVIFRDFFVFDLPALPSGKTLSAVTLRTLNYEVVNGKYPEQAISIHGVIGSIEDLVNGTSSFNALGQGPSYSEVSFDGTEAPDSFSSYSFDAAGVSLVNDALGSAIAFSGRNSREQGGGVLGVYVYGNSQHSAQDPSVFLDLEFTSPDNPSVPGPLPLIGAGAAWSWSRRLRAQNRMRGSSSATSRSTVTVTSTTSAATTTTIP